MSPAYARYRSTNDADASGPEVLLRLFDGMVTHVARAREAILENRPQDKGQSVNIVLDVLGELRANLDHKAAPDLCMNLERLYEYLGRRLTQGSANRDVGPLDEVAHHLTEMRMTWAQACRAIR
jgi:flagellar protein FliS